MIKPKKYVGGSSAVPRVFFWHTGTCTKTGIFYKSIGEHTVRQTDREKLWLYLAAF